MEQKFLRFFFFFFFFFFCVCLFFFFKFFGKKFCGFFFFFFFFWFLFVFYFTFFYLDNLEGTLIQIWIFQYMFAFIWKQYSEKFHILNPKNFNFSHISRTHISNRKSCFNVRSLTHYFHMKTKILADFQICISVL